jgi:hypothetical protein
MVNGEELVGTTECRTLYTRYCIKRCRYNRHRLHQNRQYLKRSQERLLSDPLQFTIHNQITHQVHMTERVKRRC